MRFGVLESMCGRFTLTSTQEQIAAVLPGLVFERVPQPRYNIAPTQSIAAVLNDGRGCLSFIRWGLIPSWAKDPAIGNRMINARGETVHEKPSFNRPLRLHRCLILADGFYEWKRVPGRKSKTPMYIRLKSGQPFAFAGLWDRWHDPKGVTIATGTIITTSANELIAAIHDRMPVILPPRRYDLWLAQEEVPAAELLRCLRPYAAEEMEAHPVSTSVNKPSFDDPACIEPVREQ